MTLLLSIILLVTALVPAAPVASDGAWPQFRGFVAWFQRRAAACTSSPLLFGGRVCALNETGVLQVFDAKTGREIYKARVGGVGNTLRRGGEEQPRRARLRHNEASRTFEEHTLIPAAWTDVDDYITGRLVPPDEALDAAQEASRAAGLPPISVSAAQGKFLHLLARIQGARRILEIGTLGGYSTIWLARALPDGGQIVTLEFDPKHAGVARASIARAGFGGMVDIRVGRAIDTLPTLAGGEPFDLIFIDADKPSTTAYFNWAMKLSRTGTVIVIDNVVRNGGIVDPAGDGDAQAMRAFLAVLGDDRRVDATALQTVGIKGYDGFAIAIVATPA